MTRDVATKPAAIAAMSQPGMIATGTTPRLAANVVQMTRPTARPRGMLTATPTTATVAACQVSPCRQRRLGYFGPHWSKTMDLMMLWITGGRQRTRDEHEQLLNKPGFRLHRVIPTMADVSILEAFPA